MHRHLVLAKETLAPLHSDELAAVGGGQPLPRLSYDVCLAEPSGQLGICDSLLRPCISYTCTR